MTRPTIPRTTSRRAPAAALTAAVAAAVAGVASCGQGVVVERTDDLADPTLASLSSGTDALLQAVSAVTDSVVWVSGHQGIVLRTGNGGTTWTHVPTPVGDSLQFRDVHGFSEDEAVALTAGNGSASRIYRTPDAGRSWRLAYLMRDERGFLDCLDFWDDRGIAYGDSFDGSPFILRTRDRGASWTRLEPDVLPEAPEGEGGFAASGTCARTGAGGVGWIATGAGGAARVLRTQDYGLTWEAVDVPVVRGDAAGLTTASFRDRMTGVVLGGDLAVMDAPTENAARTGDGGRTWARSTAPRMVGPIYGSAWVPGTDVVVAVGPAGADWSADAGLTWTVLDTVSYWAVGFGSSAAGWMVGPEGRVTKVSFRR